MNDVDAYYEGLKDAVLLIVRGVNAGLSYEESFGCLERALEKCQAVNAAEAIANRVQP